MYSNSLKCILICLVSASAIMSSCKKGNDDNPSKSLNKSTLTPKTWYSKGGSTIHDFKNKGIYSNTGTWKWVNNSDTMEIVTVSGGFKTYWKFYWNTDHEMNCQKIGSSSETYKDQLW